jgi:glycosyltransferase involved in cell wall biosynthesis
MSGTVILAGRLPRPLLRGLMGISTSFVMPNIPVLGDAEGFGIVALEAGCGGLPVVASDLEGIRDAVSDGVNGFLAPSDNPLAFAGAVNRLLSNEGLRKEMGARAREYVAANFGWDTIAARYLEELRYISRNED